MGLRCSLTNYGRLILLACACFPCYGADICTPADIHGPYGFQLAGSTSISGAETPIAAMGRIAFDGAGAASGVSSVNFNGLFLGNPVTGKYESKGDCTLTFSLQDTSGAFQNFSGKVAPGGDRVEIQQVDSGAHERGLMVRSAAEGCKAEGFRGQYDFALTGHRTPLVSEGSKGSGSAKASVQADGNGNLTLLRGDSKTSGTYTVESDCIVQLEFGLGDGDGSSSVKLRGILVNGGKEILAIETDPEQVGAARFSQSVTAR